MVQYLKQMSANVSNLPAPSQNNNEGNFNTGKNVFNVIVGAAIENGKGIQGNKGLDALRSLGKGMGVGSLATSLVQHSQNPSYTNKLRVAVDVASFAKGPGTLLSISVSAGELGWRGLHKGAVSFFGQEKVGQAILDFADYFDL